MEPFLRSYVAARGGATRYRKKNNILVASFRDSSSSILVAIILPTHGQVFYESTNVVPEVDFVCVLPLGTLTSLQASIGKSGLPYTPSGTRHWYGGRVDSTRLWESSPGRG